MEIIKKDFNGTQYYLVDVYTDEFSFGTVYHFATRDDDKYCFYENDNYIPIENKKYLKKIKKKLEINIDIIYKRNFNIVKLFGHKKETYQEIRRLEREDEYLIYDESSKIIHKLYPNISYEDTMNVLNDDSGIYLAKLPPNVLGAYFHNNNKIYLDYNSKVYDLKDTTLHESIHKLTNRMGFISNNPKITGLLEGGTEKICENAYGDKTSHNIYIGNSKIHINFSRTTYPLQQVIYRQMAQLSVPQIADEGIIEGDFFVFLNQFERLYGEDLLLYLIHRTTCIVEDRDLVNEKSATYFKEAQSMLLTTVFDQKISQVETEEGIIDYMNELRNFEYYVARISGDDTFKDYYISKYNYVIDLARQKGMNLSRIEEFEYTPVEFYPIRDYNKVQLSEFTQKHISEICNIPVEALPNQELDLDKCTRMKIDGLPNCYGLDVVLQDGEPISALYEGVFYGGASYISKHDKSSKIFKNLGVKRGNSEIYELANNTYMVISSDGKCEVYGIDYESSKICKGIEQQIDLGFNIEDINEYKEKATQTSLLSRLKSFFRNLVDKKEAVPILLNAFTDKTVDKNGIKGISKTRKSFVDKLNPNNEIYDKKPFETSQNSNAKGEPKDKEKGEE